MAADAFLEQIAQAYASSSPVIAELFPPFPSGDRQDVALIRQSLSGYTNAQLAKAVESRLSSLQTGPFHDLVVAYLQLLASPSPQGSSEFSNLMSCFSASVNFLQQSEGSWILSTVKKFARAVTRLCMKVPKDDESDRVGKTTNILNKALSLSVSNESRYPITYTMTNFLLQIFFSINNFRLIDRVRAMASRVPIDEYANRADRVTYRYYVGRTHLNRRMLHSARSELEWAFDNCTERCYKNRRTILTYLVAASLPLGIFPSRVLLSHYNLDTVYGNFLDPVKLGNYRQVRANLDENRGWHFQKGTYLLMREKLETLCWRNLARSVAFMSTTEAQLSLENFLVAAKLCMQDDHIPFDIDDIESICASLLDQGYIKAYILHSKKLLVLQRGPMRGFPPVSSIKLATQDD